MELNPTWSQNINKHSSQFKEKQMFLILHQAVQQAAPEQRIWVICTIWPPTTQVSYLLLHTKAHPGAGSSTGTCQPLICDPLTGAAADALYSLVSLLAVCVPAAVAESTLLANSHQRLYQHKHVRFTSHSAVYYNKGVPGMLLNISFTMPKIGISLEDRIYQPQCWLVTLNKA